VLGGKQGSIVNIRRGHNVIPSNKKEGKLCRITLPCMTRKTYLMPPPGDRVVSSPPSSCSSFTGTSSSPPALMSLVLLLLLMATLLLLLLLLLLRLLLLRPGQAAVRPTGCAILPFCCLCCFPTPPAARHTKAMARKFMPTLTRRRRRRRVFQMPVQGSALLEGM